MRTGAWRSRIAQVVAEVDGLVPVVKGNGYGFGRIRLAEVAAEFADTVAVGTVHELDGLPPRLDVVVLTPTLAPPTVPPGAHEPILTVGRTEHLDALDGWGGRVIVKLETSLRRYGGDIGLVDVARERGLDVVGVALHPPIAGIADELARQIVDALDVVDPALPVWVSHLDPDRYAALPATHTYRLRCGTMLWHGDKTALHLAADVLNVREIEADTPAGYRQTTVPSAGHLVMIGAGTANGVTALADGRSPFHHARTRLALLEPPHMHTSMAFVPDGDPVPSVGDWVDVQRPLHMTAVDDYRWL